MESSIPDIDAVPTAQPGHPSWLPWLLGAALLGGIIFAAVRMSEEREFLRVVRAVRMDWLLFAFLLQALTYVVQGEVWRVVLRQHFPLSMKMAFGMSLAKLFVDQALPSAGISGAAALAKGLEQRKAPRSAVMACLVLNIASFNLSLALTLVASIALVMASGQASALIVLPSLLFVLAGTAFTIGMLSISGRDFKPGDSRFFRFGIVRNMLGLLRAADATLVRNIRMIVATTLLQTAILLIDAVTVWILVRSLGSEVSLTGAFISFTLANLVRSAGIVPGGLGTFEAVSVATLHSAGVSVPAALSATLLFRGMTFWLPMPVGLWFSHRLFRPKRGRAVQADADHYWTEDPDQLALRLGAGAGGLSTAEAASRLESFGPNALIEHERLSRLRVLLLQLKSPLLLLLLFAAGISAMTGEWLDAAIVLAILVASVGIGFVREYSANVAAAALRARIRVKAAVQRDGLTAMVPFEEVVPGDIVQLAAGSLVPADGIILESSDCYVSESALTGESFPVEKARGALPANTALARRVNCLFLGTNVRSGTARYLVVHTGPDTQFGAIAHKVSLRPPETEFDRGIRRFGSLLTVAMLVMILLVFVAHVLQGRPPVETLLFAVALAVGLSPELLPAILSINLARGAQMMARSGVLVRRLNAIENLGSMDVLCTDKTGTLTEGVIEVEGSYDARGKVQPTALELAAINASLNTGLSNPLDDAILAKQTPAMDGIQKCAEIPFDFTRRRVSVVVQRGTSFQLITKGAFHHVIEVCSTAAGVPLDASVRTTLEDLYRDWSSKGIRIIALGVRPLAGAAAYSRTDEREMDFVGFLTFLDRPKEGAAQAIADLQKLGVAVKVITGDNRYVAQNVASLVGMSAGKMLVGADMDDLHGPALWRTVDETELFVEVDPSQKERIILALKKSGHVVGFLGDGVNDAPAMHAADTSLSVQDATDVAREAADFVLLERNLDVMRQGIEEGRRTFANTLKYILTTTSANLGNMVSMAAASLFLPFLPLLAGQILLNNFLSDIPAVGIADDAVDAEMVLQPRRWDIRFIGRFMVTFGLVSSAFDILTFAILLGLFSASVEMFRTGWFVESLLTELVIALVVRTRRPFYRSRPSSLLLYSTLGMVVIALAISYLPLVQVLGLVPLPVSLIFAIVGIVVLYVAATEVTKRLFYSREGK